MRTSERINDLAAALAVAQGQMRNALKLNTNPYFKSSYADLGTVIDTIREPLSKNGLSYIQPISRTSQGDLEVTTRLMHSSGQWIEESIYFSLDAEIGRYTDKKPAIVQIAGSLITYARRYSLSAIVGIASEDDDDGEGVKPSNGQPPKPQPPRQQEKQPEQVAETSSAQRSQLFESLAVPMLKDVYSDDQRGVVKAAAKRFANDFPALRSLIDFSQVLTSDEILPEERDTAITILSGIKGAIAMAGLVQTWREKVANRREEHTVLDDDFEDDVPWNDTEEENEQK